MLSGNLSKNPMSQPSSTGQTRCHHALYPKARHPRPTSALQKSVKGVIVAKLRGADQALHTALRERVAREQIFGALNEEWRVLDYGVSAAGTFYEDDGGAATKRVNCPLDEASDDGGGVGYAADKAADITQEDVLSDASSSDGSTGRARPPPPLPSSGRSWHLYALLIGAL